MTFRRSFLTLASALPLAYAQQTYGPPRGDLPIGAGLRGVKQTDFTQYFVQAALEPNATGSITTADAGVATYYANGTNLTASADTNYSWRYNLSNVNLPVRPPNTGSGPGTMVNIVQELILDDGQLERLNTANNSLFLWSFYTLSRDAAVDGQEDDGSCFATIGEDCVAVLAQTFLEHPEDPESYLRSPCREVVGRSDSTNPPAYSFYDPNPQTTPTNPDEHGFYTEPVPNENRDIIHTRYMEGYRSSINHLNWPIVDPANLTFYYQAAQMVMPMVVMEVGWDDATRAPQPVWASVTCRRTEAIQTGSEEIPAEALITNTTSSGSSGQSGSSSNGDSGSASGGGSTAVPESAAAALLLKASAFVLPAVTSMAMFFL